MKEEEEEIEECPECGAVIIVCPSCHAIFCSHCDWVKE